MNDINKDIENDFNNRTPLNRKELKKSERKLKNQIKKLKKFDTKKADISGIRTNYLKKVEAATKLDEIKTSLAGKIGINVDGKKFKINENYFDRIKDKQKYIRNLARRSTERTIYKLSNEADEDNTGKTLKKLQSITKKYSKTYRDDENYKGGIVNAIKSQVKSQSEINPFISPQEFKGLIEFDDYYYQSESEIESEGDDEADSGDGEKKYDIVISLSTSGRTINYTNV